MKLEAKHLLPYVDSKLKIIQFNDLWTITGINADLKYVQCVIDNNKTRAFPFQYINPVLFPSSDLLDLKFNQRIREETDIDLEDLTAFGLKLDMISYSDIMMLAEWHVDFQNLIPQGLAVDANTLK